MTEVSAAAVAVDRSARAMVAVTALSRLSGFARVAVVTNVLGITYLANTYQTANTVPNVLFELFAAGALQAVLIPSMVELLDRGDDGESERVVGAVLGLTTAVLSAVVVLGVALGPLLMRWMVSDVADAEVRAAQVRLGTFMLWFFLPQIVMYGANAVATAVLNASGSFVIPVAAPIVNNVVVIASYLLFAVMRGGAAPSLELSTAEKVVLAGGTTLAVAAFCAWPVLAAHRRVRLRPNLDLRHPLVRRVGRHGGWAVLYLAMAQLLLVAVLQIANRREGGVAVYQQAYVLFLLPHSLLAVPVLTTRFPSLSRAWRDRRWGDYVEVLGAGIRSIGFVGCLSTALLVALSEPLLRLLVHGRAATRVDEIVVATRGFAVGLVGLGLFLFLTRASYAAADTRSPALVAVGVTTVAVVSMELLAPRVAGDRLVAWLGVTYGAAQTLAAALLWARLHLRLRARHAPPLVTATALARCVVGAVIAGVVAGACSQPFLGRGTAGAAAAGLAGGLVGTAVYLGATWALGGPAPRAAVATFGADRRAAAGPESA